MCTLTLVFKTKDGNIQQSATADRPRKAYAMALDEIIKRYPREAWNDTDYVRASYDAFQMALNVPRGTACCTPWTIVYIDDSSKQKSFNLVDALFLAD